MRWACDNDCFTGLNRDKFIAMLRKYRALPGCLFIPCPDIVGSAKDTMIRFRMWRPVVKYFGYPVALVAQDGLERLAVPWDSFDSLFIGGSTAWKLSRSAADLVKEAKRRDKWVHMGRVNSVPRIRYAHAIGCDSVDGTGYSRNIQHIYNHLPEFESPYPIEINWALPLPGMEVA